MPEELIGAKHLGPAGEVKSTVFSEETDKAMWWLQQGLSVLPVALVTWTAATFIFAYITAVTLRHVDPLVPYIRHSDHMVRYKQVQALLGEKTLHQGTNQLGLVLGHHQLLWHGVFVANFQKTTLFAMHIVGAVMTFGIGALYIVVQSLLSFHMQPHLHSKTIFSIRLSIAVWTIATHIISTISEWSLAFSFISFFFTYIRDFQ
ncbi:LOW QUALITY PROTEIN: hypothetical protein CRUP_002182, partial [Coryphaenoides rupestris]